MIHPASRTKAAPGRAALAWLLGMAVLAPTPALAAETQAKAPAPTKGEELTQTSAWPAVIDLGVDLGLSYRIGSASQLLVTERSGLVAGGGIVLAPSRIFAIGASYEHVFIGSETLRTDDIDGANVERDMHALWFDLRVHPLRRSTWALFAELGAGFAWQFAEATVILGPERPGVPPRIVACDASDSTSVGLRASGGAEAQLAERLFFIGRVTFENVRLSGELLDGCISGAGTTSILSLRAGIAYRFDLAPLFD